MAWRLIHGMAWISQIMSTTNYIHGDFTSGKMVCIVSAYLRMAVMDADGTHMLPLPVTWRQQKVVAIACYGMSVRPGVTRCDKMTSFDFKVSSSLAGEVSM